MSVTIGIPLLDTGDTCANLQVGDCTYSPGHQDGFPECEDGSITGGRHADHSTTHRLRKGPLQKGHPFLSRQSCKWLPTQSSAGVWREIWGSELDLPRPPFAPTIFPLGRIRCQWPNRFRISGSASRVVR